MNRRSLLKVLSCIPFVGGAILTRLEMSPPPLALGDDPVTTKVWRSPVVSSDGQLIGKKLTVKLYVPEELLQDDVIFRSLVRENIRRLVDENFGW